MPRQSRLVIPGLPHHITQRGNNQRPIFFSDEDRAVYLALLGRYTAEYAVDVIGFCLMTNHVHLIVIPSSPRSLSKALGRTHNDYSRWLHIRRRESGHLWQNRFFSCPLERAYVWAALAYVERNPVRAGMVPVCDAWSWSSARSHLGIPHGFVSLELWSRHWTPTLWRDVLTHGMAEAEVRGRLREATRTGWPLGDESFVQECESRTGRHLRKQKPGPKVGIICRMVNQLSIAN